MEGQVELIAAEGESEETDTALFFNSIVRGGGPWRLGRISTAVLTAAARAPTSVAAAGTAEGAVPVSPLTAVDFAAVAMPPERLASLTVRH